MCWLLFQEVLEKNLRHAQDLKRREDAESADNDSNMSTSSNLEPFANDDLGIVSLFPLVQSSLFISCQSALLITWSFAEDLLLFTRVPQVSSLLTNQFMH